MATQPAALLISAYRHHNSKKLFCWIHRVVPNTLGDCNLLIY